MKYFIVLGVALILVIGAYYISNIDINDEDIEYKNIWVVKVENKELICVMGENNKNGSRYEIGAEDKNGIRKIELRNSINEKYENIMADIVVKNKKVIKITLKPAIIKGKLIAVDGESNIIDIEKYGKVKLANEYKIYEFSSGNNIKELDEKNKVFNNVNGNFNKEVNYKSSSIKDLNIGLEGVEYIVEKDKICGILLNGYAQEIGKNIDYNSGTNNIIKNNGEDTNIKVLLKNSNYSGILHNNVSIKSLDNLELLYVSDAKEVSSSLSENMKIDILEDMYLEKKEYAVKKIKSNELLKLTCNSKFFDNYNRVIIVNKDNKSGVSIPTIKRSTKGIKYKGNIEIIKDKNGLVVVNDVNLEDYLYSVVPSEMPESYPIEALKAQAICARTYAMHKIQNSGYKKYGAHLDDSISYQVYNNMKYGANSVKAVNETKGKVIRYKNKLASIFYYSTSSGYSSNTKDVFGGEKLAYLSSKKQSIDELSNNVKREKTKIKNTNITKEKEFKKHILSTDEDYFERNCEWFRWKIFIDVDKLSRSINDNIYRMNKTGNTSNITVYSKKLRKYVKGNVYTIGTLKSIKVRERKSGGIVTKIIIKGTKKNICVKNQYTIRQILAVENQTIVKNNGKNVSNMSTLPSCYFTINKKGNKYVINGGGFGHGVGMSQCGASELAKRGYGYKEILEFYFEGGDI